MWSAAQPCPTLCDPMDYNPPGFSVLGISQARILKWVDISSLGDLPNSLFVTQQVAIGDMFTNGETIFGSLWSFRFLRTPGYRGKRSRRRFESEQDYFTNTSVLLVEMCALMLLFGIFTKKKKKVIMNSIPWRVCLVLFCFVCFCV